MRRFWAGYLRACPAMWALALLVVGVVKAFRGDDGLFLLGVASALVAGICCVYEYAPQRKHTEIHWLTIEDSP